jgi:hypothetical protein
MLMMLQGLKPLTFSWLNVAVKTATHKSMAVRCVAIEATAREEKTKRAETLRPGKLGRSSAAPLHDLAEIIGPQHGLAEIIGHHTGLPRS